MLSFIVPAHDEAGSIVATVESIVASAQGHEFEVIVVDDASMDRTKELAEAVGARVDRLPGLVTLAPRRRRAMCSSLSTRTRASIRPWSRGS